MGAAKKGFSDMKARFLGFLAALVTVSTWAQGTIYFNTRFPSANVNAPVVLMDAAPHGPGPAYSAGLYIKQQDSFSLIPGSITTFRDGTLNPLFARYVEPIVVEVPGAPQGATVTVRMRVWLTAAGSWEEADSMILRGESADLVISNLGGGPVPPADLPASFTGFVMMWPEPSTYALGAIGAAMLYFFGGRNPTRTGKEL
jgi:hypothetical protein